MSSAFSPINVVMLGTGGILLYSSYANRSPINVIKTALGLEDAKPFSTGGGGSIDGAIIAGSQVLSETALKPVTKAVDPKTNPSGAGNALGAITSTSTAPFTGGGAWVGEKIAQLFGWKK